MTDLPFAAETHVGPIRWADLPAPWILTILVVVGFLWMRALYRHERGRSRPWQRHLLAAIRTAVLVAILLVLSGPYREETRTATEPSHLVVLIDNSASMQTKDKYPADEARRLLENGWSLATRPGSIQEVSRGDLVRQYLSPEGEAMLRSWNERFVLHVFAFDGDWRSLGAPPRRPGEVARPGETVDEDPVGTLGASIRNLPFDGGRTRLGAILRSVANEFGRRQDRHLAGVILVSDGRDTSEGESPLEVLAALGPVKEGLHVTPVLVGNPASGKNLWVERIRAKDEVLVGDEVIVETTVRQKGFETTGIRDVAVTMTAEMVRDESGQRVDPPRNYAFPQERRTRTNADVDLAPAADSTAEVRLRAPFNVAGTFKVTIRAEAPPPHDAEDSIEQDNARVHFIRVRKTRIKVLYVDSQPTWDWRFLSNFLTREPRHEDREDHRNRFAVHVLLQGAEANYAQPASADLQPLHAFPRTRRELFEYDVLILGDVDWKELATTPQESKRICQLIVDFVESGGGIALQSGFDYRNPLDFLGTPLAQLLPIVADRSDQRDSERHDLTTPFNIELTDIGKTHPIFAVVPGTTDEPVATPEIVAKTWRGDVTGLSDEWKWYWLYRAKGGLRPGGPVPLARVRVGGGDRSLMDDRGQPLVVFASMNFGKGRVLWSALDTISRIRRESRDEIYGAFWEQIIRYLATYRLLGGNTRLKIFTDKEEYFVGDTSTVTITALDEQFEPLDDDRLQGVHIETPDGETIELVDEKAPASLKLEGAAGSYRYHLPMRKHGTYRIWIEQSTRGPDGRTTKERAERRISAVYRAKEDILKMPDLETMHAILEEANPSSRQGDVLRLYELDSFISNTQNRPRERVLERNEKTQWDKGWVLFVIVALLALEWGLRKRWQMI